MLEELAAEIRQRHAGRRVVVKAVDVTDLDAARDAIRALFAELGDVGLVVANAGIGGNHEVGAGDFARSRDIVVTNLLGAMATVDAAVECWRARHGAGSRRIVGITSVAGFRGLPGSSAYSASKAGFSVYLEAARGEIRSLGIDVVDIAPGFIDTPMNQHVATRPFLIDPTTARGGSRPDRARRLPEHRAGLSLERDRLAHAHHPPRRLGTARRQRPARPRLTRRRGPC